MVFDRSLVPTQLAQGPAVGFLILTQCLAELGLSDTRSLCDWHGIESRLRKLGTALDEYLSREDQDHELALEFIIHKDRVSCTLDAWQKGSMNSVERTVLRNQERYVRERQLAAREGRLGDDNTR